MRTAVLTLLVLMFTACQGGRSTVVVTVETRGVVRDVAKLRFTVEHMTQSGSLDFDFRKDLIEGAPVTVALILPPDHRGAIVVRVYALAPDHSIRKEGMADGNVEPGQRSDVKLTILGEPVVDMRMSDLAPSGDASGLDLAEADGDAADLSLPDLTMPDLLPPPQWAVQVSGLPDIPFGIWGSSSNDVYVVCLRGTILHSMGDGNWTPQTSGVNSLGAVWGSGLNDIYAIGSQIIIHSTGNGVWTRQTIGVPMRSFLGIWGSDRNNIFVVGNPSSFGNPGTILASPGDGAWTLQSNSDTSSVTGIWGSGSQFYASARGGVLHSMGGAVWSRQYVTGALLGIWGSSAGDIYVVGEAGRIEHSNGDGTWTPQTTSSTHDYQAIWGSGAGDIYVVGDKAVPPPSSLSILHSTGTGTWASETTAISAGGLFGVWGSSSQDVYAVGSDGTTGVILHRR